MLLYEIIGEDQEKAKDLVQLLDLENTLSVRHPHVSDACSLGVYCKIEYWNACGEDFPNGRLKIYMNESQPEIRIDCASSIEFQYGNRYLASFIMNGVMVELEDETAEDTEFDEKLKDIIPKLKDLKYY